MERSDASRFASMAEAIASLERQRTTIESAAKILADAATRDALIHIFGVDLRAAEIEGGFFFRPGRLACVNPVYDPAFSAAHGAYRSELCRALDGLTPRILDYYENISPGEPLLLLSLDPESTAFVQALQWARERELRIIVMIPDVPDNPGATEGADVVIRFGRMYDELTLYAALDELAARAAELAPGAAVWKGNVYPDLTACDAIIERYRWRIRHL